MADQPTDASPAAAPAPDQPARPRRKKRTWLKVVGAILLLLILLVVFLPAIASTGPVKSFVVNKVNDNLNGKVEIKEWSIGWTSGVDIDSLKVLDAQGITILTVSRIRVPMSLLNAAKGNYALGDVLIERPDFVKLEIDEEGRTNYEKLVKSDPDAPDEKPTEEGAGELPKFSGKVTIKELKGSIFQAGGGPPLMVIQPSDIVIDVPDSNGPISNDIKLAIAAGEGKAGTLALIGNVDAIDNNRVVVEKLAADQTLELANLDTAALAPILKMAGLDATLAGVGNGKLAMKVAAGTDVSANGELRFDNFKFGGKLLNDDTFETKLLRIPVQVTSTSAGGVARVTAKETGVEFDQGKVTVTADAPLDAIQNAVARKPPGRDGTLGVDVKIPKLAELANQLPNTLQLVQGVRLTGGSLSEMLNATLTKEAATIVSTLDLKDVKGTKDGAPLRSLDPVHLMAGATSYGGTDLRNLLLKLTSGFASAEIPQGGGESLSKLTVTSNVDLKKLREQAGQFTDVLDQLESGTATLTLTTNGDLTKENSLVDTKLDVELKDLNVVQPATQPAQTATAMLREPWMRLGVTGGIQRGTTNFVESVKGLVVTLQTNNPQKPTVDLETSADLVMKTEGESTVVTAPAFELTKLNVDIPAARDEFRTFLKALEENGLEPTAGRVTLNNPMAGSYDGKTLVINAEAPLSLVAANVTVRKTDAGAKSTPIDDRTIRVNAAGAFDLGETFSAKLSQLRLVEDRKLFSIAKSDEGDFIVRLPPGGTPQGSGAIVLTADLVGLNQVAAAFGSPLIEKRPDGSMDLRAGQLGGRIKLSATEKETNIDGAVDIKGLTLTTSGEPIQNETIQTVIKLTSPADGSAVGGRVDVVSGFVKAAVENLQLQLQKQLAGGATTQPAVWEMVRRADVTADVENLAKAYTLYSALTPTTQPVAADEGKPAEPEPPLNVQGGSAKVKVAVAREGEKTNLNVSEARISNLAFAKGPGAFKASRDMVINLAASLDATDAIKQISVTKGAFDLAVATATLTEPLIISNLDTTATAKGALKVDGKIEDISRLLEALSGQAAGTSYPYAGQLAMTQRITNAGGGPIQLVGNVRATDFIVYQQGTQTPAFTEKQLDLTQDVTIDTDAKRAAIKTFTLDMPSSGALKLNVTGGVTDWAVARKIDEKTRLDITYDLAKLWPIIKPLISEKPEDYKDLVIAGQAQRTFLLRGSYPADVPFHAAVKSLVASGGLAVQRFSYEGVDIENLELPISLRDGHLLTVYADRPRDKRHPPVAKCNGGTIDLGGLVINLGYEQPRLSIAKKQRLLSEVSMNPLFAHNVLGKFINPTFVDPEQARGLIDLTVGQVDNVPLGDLITGKNEGRAHLILSIREVNIGNKFFNTLLSRLDVDNRDGAVRANIRDAQLTIENGILTQDMDFVLENFTLAFDGKVRLKDQALLPLVMSIPTAQLRGLDDNLRKYVPEAITVPITGTTTAPKWNLDVVVQNLLVEAGKKALLGNVLERAGGRSTTQPAKEDPLGGLIDIFGGKKKREEEKKPPEKEPSGSDRISQPKK